MTHSSHAYRCSPMRDGKSFVNAPAPRKVSVPTDGIVSRVAYMPVAGAKQSNPLMDSTSNRHLLKCYSAPLRFLIK
jgi:hypothetical protein